MHERDRFVHRIEQSLKLPDFDSHLAMLTMGMAGRLAERPADQPGEARVGAVLMLLYPQKDDLRVLYTKRHDGLRNHSGQISFPGGRVDEGENEQQAALRELHEEVGIGPDQVTVLGKLSPLYIQPSDFIVHPFVAWCDRRPDFRLNPDEVESLIEPRFTLLLDPTTRCEEQRVFRRFGSRPLTVPYFSVDQHKIWGATAIITAEFLERWKLVPKHD